MRPRTEPSHWAQHTLSFNINNQQRHVVHHQLSNHLFLHYTTKPILVQNLQTTDLTAFQKTECDEADGNWLVHFLRWSATATS